MTERFVVLGLARPDRQWFRAVAQWSTTARLPVEFLKCVSAEEARARLGSGRRFSALLLDPGAHGADRDLVDVARSHDLAVVAVDDPRLPRAWRAFGVSAVVRAEFEPHDLLAALEEHASPVASVDAPGRSVPVGAEPGWQSPLVTVMGRGGAGTSVVALAVAQGLARDPRFAGSVLLADLALHADQALLHEVGDVVPGLPELVEAHRLGIPGGGDVLRLTHAVPERGYRLLLGLRRHRDWTRLRRRAVSDSVASLRREFRLVIADADSDLEGEHECGSVDVEDRNVLARSATALADLVIVATAPTVTGLAGAAGVIADLQRHSVEQHRILPVVTRAPRSPRARAEITRALTELTRSAAESADLATPVHLAHRRGLDDLLRDAAPLPTPLTQPLAAAVAAMLDRLPRNTSTIDEPVAVAAGSLGHWSEVESG